jgi:uncharacterized protein (TIGR01777 family)
MSLRVVLVGGSGFLGSRLRERLVSLGHEVVVVGRGPALQHDGWRTVQWDAASLGSWVDALDGSDVVVHLAGKRVDCRPTEANIDALIASRAGTVQLVGAALSGLSKAPTRWVQLSSLAIFGDAGDEMITESTEPPTTGPRQQVEVCQRWEAAFREASADIEETVLLRPAIGIGGAGDPATKQLARLARFGLAGPVGGGDQWVSWIGEPDLADLLLRAVVDPEMRGLYHLAAPTPVRNAELMAAYRNAVGRGFGLPAPAALAKLGAWLLGSDPSLALTGRRCVPQRLLDEGYDFQSSDIETAVAAAVDASRRRGGTDSMNRL